MFQIQTVVVREEAFLMLASIGKEDTGVADALGEHMLVCVFSASFMRMKKHKKTILASSVS